MVMGNNVMKYGILAIGAVLGYMVWKNKTSTTSTSTSAATSTAASDLWGPLNYGAATAKPNSIVSVVATPVYKPVATVAAAAPGATQTASEYGWEVVKNYDPQTPGSAAQTAGWTPQQIATATDIRQAGSLFSSW